MIKRILGTAALGLAVTATIGTGTYMAFGSGLTWLVVGIFLAGTAIATIAEWDEQRQLAVDELINEYPNPKVHFAGFIAVNEDGTVTDEEIPEDLPEEIRAFVEHIKRDLIGAHPAPPDKQLSDEEIAEIEEKFS